MIIRNKHQRAIIHHTYWESIIQRHMKKQRAEPLFVESEIPLQMRALYSILGELLYTLRLNPRALNHYHQQPKPPP